MLSSHYEEACAYIEGIGKFSVKHSNEHTRECLARLMHPEQGAGLYLHVAGTNGKGSVCAYLTSVLRRAGYRVGTFTSPHLVTLRERIAVDGEPMSEADFLEAFEAVRQVAEAMDAEGKSHPSYFEFLYLMGMVHFQKAQVEVSVVETGLGGRLDATNSVQHPTLTIITSIGFDHMQYLGNTIPEIAGEKAGIIKPGVPCIYDGGNEEAAAVIRDRARQSGAPAVALLPESYRILRSSMGELTFATAFSYDGRQEFSIRSSAPYQAENAALALLAIKELKVRRLLPKDKIPDGQQVAEGLHSMYWPARMEEIEPRIFLDGAHNDDGIRRFIEAVRAIAGQAPVHLLFSVVNDKDFQSMITSLVREIPWEDVIVTEIEGGRKTESASLADLFVRAGARSVTACADFREAYRLALSRQEEGAYVFICGSLYLAGEIEELRA